MKYINTIFNDDCIRGMKQLPGSIIDTCVTSPPYFGLRDYGHSEQIGNEKELDLYINNLLNVFNEVHRLLKNTGTLWLNIGDSYNGSGGAGGDYSEGGFREGQPKYKGRNIEALKPKNLIGVPWHLAFALQKNGWYLRQDIIWNKPNPMPESVTDRCTKSHEYIFLLSKSQNYYFDNDAIKEQSVTENERRNKRSVWTVNTKPFKDAHFATFPQELIKPCILAGSPIGGLVLDPFMGSGTTAFVSKMYDRNYVGFELNSDYIKIAERRLMQSRLVFEY